MSWAAVIAGGAALASGAAGAYSSNQAADAQAKGGKKALALQNQQYQNALTMYEPYRATGYGALSDLAHLYGWNMPDYTGLDALRSGGTAGADAYAPITVSGKGKGAGGGGGSSLFMDANKAGAAGFLAQDPVLGSLGLGSMFGGGGKTRWGGTIDPTTGTVDVAKKDGDVDAMWTEYLRTGKEPEGLKMGKYKRIQSAIDQLKASGWTYNPNATAEAGPATDTGGTSADGMSGNMDRFFTSPDYQFRLDQGQKMIERSAAARSGALTPGTAAELTQYGSNLASGEYGNYVNRLLAAAGLGQTATNATTTAGMNYANNAGNLQQSIGDSRASGVLGTANSITNSVNGGLQNWMMWKYLQGQGG